MRNINQIVNDVLQIFSNYCQNSWALHMHVSPDYRKGFEDGVKAVQMSFLEAKENPDPKVKE